MNEKSNSQTLDFGNVSAKYFLMRPSYK